MEKVDISGGTFSESTSYEGYEGFAMDGDPTTQWAAKGAGECWLQADFDDAVTFNCIKIYETQTYGPRMMEVEVQTSETGEENSWTTVKTFSNLRDNGIYDEELVLDETLTSSHIKLVIDGGETEININEVEFYNRETTAREKISALITEAEEIDTRLYTIQSSRELIIAISNAKIARQEEILTDEQINDAADTLRSAMNDLELLGENLALGAAAEANSTYEGSYDQDGYGPEYVVDGDLGTRWASKTEADGYEFEITLDLGQPKTFNQLILFEDPDYSGRMNRISAQVSDDGINWEDWRMDAEYISTVSSLVSEEVTKQYVRVLMTGNSLNLDEIGLYNDENAVETTQITEERPIDPDWIKPIPSETPNTYQLRKQELGYGMFIHFGVNTFTNQGWGTGSEDPSVFNPNPETYDPEQWAKTAWEAGMNYIVLITKHHDGFAMFDTKYSEHKVTNCGHEGADFDVVAALAEACKKYGIKLGLYYSIWDMNWEQNHPKSNYVDERAWDQAYTDFAYNQIEELMTNYGEICELWIDGGWEKETERWEYERIYNMVKHYQPGCQMSVNLTLGDRDIASLQGGEEIVNFPSDFKLFDGKDTADSGDPKIFTYQGENYYLPFEGTFVIGNGWFWNTDSSESTLSVDADQIKRWYEKYQEQDNTLVINVPPSNQGVQTEHEINLIYEAARELGIARGDARADIDPDECAVEIRHVTTSGAIAAPTEYIYGTEGENYTTSVMNNMEKLGYQLVETPAQADGVFSKDKITVEYVYKEIEKIDSIEKVRGIYTVSGVQPVLPDTVYAVTNRGNRIEMPVQWNLDGEDFADSTTVTGTVEGLSVQAAAEVTVVPENIQYFIDCNSLESPVYAETDAYADLLNEAADQSYTDGSWGYLEEYGQHNGDVNDIYDSGWYAYSGQSIQYTVPLEAGDYRMNLGFKEWWNQDRPMKVSLTINGETTELGTTNTWKNGNPWNEETYDFSCESAGEATITVVSNGGSDPVLSYIRIQNLLDTQGLKDALAQAAALDRSQYEDTELESLDAAVESAQPLLYQAASAQADLDSAAETIAAELAALEGSEEPEEPETADKTSLNLVIAMAEKLEAQQAETGCYTEETWAAVQSALEAARALAENADAAQEDVDNAFLELITAVNLLENAVQRVGLEAAIEGAKAILADEEALLDYTPESVENLKTVLAEAENVYALESADQETVNAAARSLMDAVTSLVVVDKDTRLDILIQKAEEVLANADQYTSASVENLQAALEAAQLVADDRDASEEQINAAYLDLAEAMSSLVRKADKSELVAALDKADEILADTSKYVEESVTGLQAAADAAQAVYDQEDADAATVGEAVKSLVNEILKARLMGDVDGNGTVDTADSAEVLEAAAEAQTLDEMQSLAADVNGDGAADSSDAAEILQFAAEQKDSF